MQTTHLIAVRHGQTDWNQSGRIQGHTDIALNSTGLAQAAHLAQALSQEPITAIYASPLQRAWQTAQAISQLHKLPINAVPALKERHFGLLEGLTWSQIHEKYPEVETLWHQRNPNWAPDGGESLIQVEQRVLHTLKTLAHQHPQQTIIIVTHGGVLDVLYRTAMNLPTSAPRQWSLANTAINRLLISTEGLHIVSWGDEQHLPHHNQPDAPI